MSAPRCLVIGAGRMAGGYIAPTLRAAGWELVFACRDDAVRAAIAMRRGLLLDIVGDRGGETWIDGIDAVSLTDARLPAIAARADLIAVAVGPAALTAAGRRLAPLLRARFANRRDPVNIITFENHRRAPETLMTGIVAADPALAREIGIRVGIGGGAVWRIIASREITPGGVRFVANDEDECYVDRFGLIPGSAPLDGSIPGLELVRGFDLRMIEKLWLFNAGHCAAAYRGWQSGAATIEAALRDPATEASVAAVVVEAQQALAAHVARMPAASPLPRRATASILARYRDPALADPVARVARDPRRKLAPDDRLVGPALACLGAGIRPVALAAAIGAALAYDNPADEQAVNLNRERDLVGLAEVMMTVCGLDHVDELSRLVSEQWAILPREAVTR